MTQDATLRAFFTWRWETPGRWGNPPSRGRKIKRVYMQSYNPGVLGWGFLRLLLRLQLRSLSRGVPSSHLEKDERLILGHVCIYSWKRHALCYAVLGEKLNYSVAWQGRSWLVTTDLTISTLNTNNQFWAKLEIITPFASFNLAESLMFRWIEIIQSQIRRQSPNRLLGKRTNPITSKCQHAYQLKEKQVEVFDR